MQFFLTLLIAASVFGVCYLVDKGFTKLFRSKAQHRSGLAVRAPKRYGIFGTVLTAIGVMAIAAGAMQSTILLIGGIIVLLIGLWLAGYYLSYGIFYDGETFLVSGFGKKDKTFHYADIVGQKLYLVTGGTVVIELHLKDCQTVSVQSTMDGVYPFLDTAFAGWCLARGLDPQGCDFHDPSQSLWFPTVEDV